MADCLAVGLTLLNTLMKVLLSMEDSAIQLPLAQEGGAWSRTGDKPESRVERSELEQATASRVRVA